MPEWNDYDVLTEQKVANHFGITDRTLRRWIEDGYFPRATMFGRQRGWRWGQIRRWMEATEYLQGLGLKRLVAPEDEETAVDDDATSGHSRTSTGHSRTSGAEDDLPTSGKPKTK